jgi:hypothetical protein
MGVGEESVLEFWGREKEDSSLTGYGDKGPLFKDFLKAFSITRLPPAACTYKITVSKS